jgi:hypothetical protein
MGSFVEAENVPMNATAGSSKTYPGSSIPQKIYNLRDEFSTEELNITPKEAILDAFQKLPSTNLKFSAKKPVSATINIFSGNAGHAVFSTGFDETYERMQKAPYQMYIHLEASLDIRSASLRDDPHLFEGFDKLFFHFCDDTLNKQKRGGVVMVFKKQLPLLKFERIKAETWVPSAFKDDIYVLLLKFPNMQLFIGGLYVKNFPKSQQITPDSTPDNLINDTQQYLKTVLSKVKENPSYEFLIACDLNFTTTTVKFVTRSVNEGEKDFFGFLAKSAIDLGWSTFPGTKTTDFTLTFNTNFVGARSEIEDLHDLFQKQTHRREIATFCADRSIVWKFIPPRSPNFGGLWESGVKSITSRPFNRGPNG